MYESPICMWVDTAKVLWSTKSSSINSDVWSFRVLEVDGHKTILKQIYKRWLMSTISYHVALLIVEPETCLNMYSALYKKFSVTLLYE